MKDTVLGRALASLCAALLVALGMVVGFAPAASANHNTIRAVVECGDTATTWTVRWSLENSEADKSETVTASSDPSLVPVGTVIGPGQTLTVEEVLDTPRDRVIEVTATWDSGNSNTNKGWLTKDRFPLDCGEGGTEDTCAELPGVQPEGFACTMEPTVRQVDRLAEGCAVGGVRTWVDVYTTTYSFKDGQWVANPEEGPVRTDETFTPYTADELIALGCAPQIATNPSLLVVDACGVDDDSVTLSKSDTYTGLDNGDGTATFTAAAGYVFSTPDGNRAQVTLTYHVPSAEPCALVVADVATTAPTCTRAGSLTIPEQPTGVAVSPRPGTYGPGAYDVEFTALPGYELAADPSRSYRIGALVTTDCPGADEGGSPDLPDTGGGDPDDSNSTNPSTNPSSNPSSNAGQASPVLPATGASNALTTGLFGGMFALLSGGALIAVSRGRWA